MSEDSQQLLDWIEYEYGNLQEHLDRIEEVNHLSSSGTIGLQCVYAMRDALKQFVMDDPDECDDIKFYGVDIVNNLLQKRTLNGDFLLNWMERHQMDMNVLDVWRKRINDVVNLPDDDPNKESCVGMLYDVLNQFRTDEPEYCDDIEFFGVDDRLNELTRQDLLVQEMEFPQEFDVQEMPHEFGESESMSEESSAAELKSAGGTGSNMPVVESIRSMMSTMRSDMMTAMRDMIRSEMGLMKTEVSKLKTEVSKLKTAVSKVESGFVKFCGDVNERTVRGPVRKMR